MCTYTTASVLTGSARLPTMTPAVLCSAISSMARQRSPKSLNRVALCFVCIDHQSSLPTRIKHPIAPPLSRFFFKVTVLIVHYGYLPARLRNAPGRSIFRGAIVDHDYPERVRRFAEMVDSEGEHDEAQSRCRLICDSKRVEGSGRDWASVMLLG